MMWNFRFLSDTSVLSILISPNHHSDLRVCFTGVLFSVWLSQLFLLIDHILPLRFSPSLSCKINNNLLNSCLKWIIILQITNGSLSLGVNIILFPMTSISWGSKSLGQGISVGSPTMKCCNITVLSHWWVVKSQCRQMAIHWTAM